MSELSPRECLEKLLRGNARFVGEKTARRTRQTLTRLARERLALVQTPFAAVVSCSDSRVPAEIVFDQGLGDLFIVRNAGAVLSEAALASVELACTRLGTRLVLVLTHERCGAIRAAAEAMGGQPMPSESLAGLIGLLRPALVDATGDAVDEETRCERAALLHARRAAEEIAASPVIRPLVEAERVLVAAAYFRLVEGTVQVLFERPPQTV